MRSIPRSRFDSRLHADRTPGRHRHHRRPDRPAAAGRAGRPRGRTTCPVHQQPQADRPGRHTITRSYNGCFPIGVTMKPDVDFGFQYVEDQSTFVSMLGRSTSRHCTTPGIPAGASTPGPTARSMRRAWRRSGAPATVRSPANGTASAHTTTTRTSRSPTRVTSAIAAKWYPEVLFTASGDAGGATIYPAPMSSCTYYQPIANIMNGVYTYGGGTGSRRSPTGPATRSCTARRPTACSRRTMRPTAAQRLELLQLVG